MDRRYSTTLPEKNRPAFAVQAIWRSSEHSETLWKAKLLISPAQPAPAQQPRLCHYRIDHQYQASLRIRLKQKSWVFRMVLSYSRKAYSEVVYRQGEATGALPGRLIRGTRGA